MVRSTVYVPASAVEDVRPNTVPGGDGRWEDIVGWPESAVRPCTWSPKRARLMVDPLNA